MSEDQHHPHPARPTEHPADTDPSARYADYLDPDAETEERMGRRRRRGPVQRQRIAREGVSGRVEVDSDEYDTQKLTNVDRPDLASKKDENEDDDWVAAPGLSPLSSYDVATHGPKPVPDWLITELAARDTPLGIVKTGKEADVTLLERALLGGEGCLLAVKTYRSSEHRMFHRDSGYLEGRRTRRSREGRAIAGRTRFGRELLSHRWSGAEFAALTEIWTAGGRVPYPVQMLGNEVMMEFIGDPSGTAAPRLADHDDDTAGFTDRWHDLVDTLEVFARIGLTHGDLSPYNILATNDGVVVIDLPQVVDLVGNPQGPTFLQRDCVRVAEFFAARGVIAADAEVLADHLWFAATGNDACPG